MPRERSRHPAVHLRRSHAARAGAGLPPRAWSAVRRDLAGGLRVQGLPLHGHRAALRARKGSTSTSSPAANCASRWPRGFPAERIHFHGNNKSAEELAEALAAGVGRIVVDNFHELSLLAELAGERGQTRRRSGCGSRRACRRTRTATSRPGRRTPSSASPSHHGRRRARRSGGPCAATAGLRLVGLHAHIGSQIYEPESLAEAAERLVAFAAAMHAATRLRAARTEPRRRLGRAHDRGGSACARSSPTSPRCAPR